MRKQEGLEDHAECSPVRRRRSDGTIAVRERHQLAIDFEHGQKTGYFLDQRDNRATVAALARGARVLDAYCYAGGFTLAALAGGAREVVAIDTSARALDDGAAQSRAERPSGERRRLVHGEAGELPGVETHRVAST